MTSNKSVPFQPRYVLCLITVISAVVLLLCIEGVGQETTENMANSQTAAIPAPRDYDFKNESVRDSIDRLARSIKLNVVYHLSSLSIVDNPNSVLLLHNISAPDAIDALLNAHGLAQFQINRRAIMVVDQNHSHGPIASVQSVMERAITEQEREVPSGDDEREQPPTLDVAFKTASLSSAIENVAYMAHLKVRFDPAIGALTRVRPLTIDLRQVTKAQALKYILDAYDLKYEEVNEDTINIVSKDHKHSSTPLEEIIKKTAMKPR